MSESKAQNNDLVLALLKDSEILGTNLTNHTAPGLVSREDAALADHAVAKSNLQHARSEKLREANARKSAAAKAKTSNSKQEAETKNYDQLLTAAAEKLKSEEAPKPKTTSRKRTTRKSSDK